MRHHDTMLRFRSLSPTLVDKLDTTHNDPWPRPRPRPRPRRPRPGQPRRPRPHPKSQSHSSKPSALQQDFDSRIPAELPTDPLLIYSHEYPALRALRTDDEIGDGLWICCRCLHENILRHWRGRFPFKHLQCVRCSRTICADCCSSEILSPLPWGVVDGPMPADDSEVRYLHVCVSCGLSHRAAVKGTMLDFYGVVCAGCQVTSYGEWPRYYIGDVEPYRRDPDASFMRLCEERAERAAELAFRPECIRESLKLSCRNPG
jgi:hypothetical protein